MQELLEQTLVWIQGLGAFGPYAFILLYIGGTLVFAPTALLGMAAGALFGISLGFVLVSAASTLSGAVLFLVGRYLSRGWMLKKVASNPKVRALDNAVGEQGWKMVLMLRLSATLPFSILNYGLGLSSIRFKQYVLTSLLATMPGTILYVYMGHVAGEIVMDKAVKRNPAEWIFLAVGILATAAIVVKATKLVRKSIKGL